MTAQLQNRNIVLAVTGGIAAYKACTLCRLLVKEGAKVRVIMTPAATKFVGPDTFAALSGNSVGVEIFGNSNQISHIAYASGADLIAVAPATANTIAKISAGLADNLVTASVLAATCPVLIAPAMNCNMYRNKATRQNLNTLMGRGLYVMTPGEGELACGTSGEGRMPEPEEILAFIIRLLTPGFNAKRLGLDENSMLPPPEKPLELAQTKLLPKAGGVGLRVLITAGPTSEAIDPVRVITNRSSGKMGYALAQAARERGAEVLLVSGPTNLNTPAGVKRIDVTTAQQMLQAVENEATSCDIVIGCAAVSDYRPETEAKTKITKQDSGDTLTVKFVKNPDIIATVGKLEQRRPYTVGFAAETDHETEHAKAKLARKNLDLIVLNNVADKALGFGSEDNEVWVYDRDGEVAHLPRQHKALIAGSLINLIFTSARAYLKNRA